MTIDYLDRAEDCPSLKRLRRLHRAFKRRNLRSYEGYSINVPRVGDVLMHFRPDLYGPRVSIRINVFGVVRRAATEYVTVAELMGEAA